MINRSTPSQIRMNLSSFPSHTSYVHHLFVAQSQVTPKALWRYSWEVAKSCKQHDLLKGRRNRAGCLVIFYSIFFWGGAREGLPIEQICTVYVYIYIYFFLGGGGRVRNASLDAFFLSHYSHYVILVFHCHFKFVEVNLFHRRFVIIFDVLQNTYIYVNH